MAKMTIEIPDKDYKKLKMTVVKLGVSIKDYVLQAIHLQEKIENGNHKSPKTNGRAAVKAIKKTSKSAIKKC